MQEVDGLNGENAHAAILNPYVAIPLFPQTAECELDHVGQYIELAGYKLCRWRLLQEDRRVDSR